MLFGALANSAPDIDFVAAFWNDPASNLLAHRGFTHSLLFGVIAVFFFALLASHYQKHHRIKWNFWILFFAVEVGAHLFIDVFNSYGMGLLEPFSHTRFSLNTIYVADPFFSIWLAISFMALLVLAVKNKRRKGWAKAGLAMSSIYLCYCAWNKVVIDTETKQVLTEEHIRYNSLFTTPTALNNWLWFVVAGDGKGFNIGYRYVFDDKDTIAFHYFPKNDYLLSGMKNDEEVQHLIRFSQGFYTVEKRTDTIVFNVLRFGQIVGWYDPNERFVFQYFLQKNPLDNKLALQRGRFARWDKTTLSSLVNRIKGN